MRFMIVDDERFVVKLVTRQLAGLGYTDVIGWSSAREVLAELARGHDLPDVLLCDLQMPDMDGVELIRHLASEGFTGSLVLMSGEDEQILSTAGRFAAASGIHVAGALRKPMATIALQEAVNAHLARTPGRARPARPARSADALRHAIANGELLNHYQPKVSLSTGELVGVESLVRWKHPTDGMVFPDEFIPLAEESGAIDDLTACVLAVALRDGRTWADAGLRSALP